MPRWHQQTPKGNAATQTFTFLFSFPAPSCSFLSKDSSILLGSEGSVPAEAGCGRAAGPLRGTGTGGCGARWPGAPLAETRLNYKDPRNK